MKITRVDPFQVEWSDDPQRSVRSAFIRIETDEGAALGGAGAVYVYNLIWTVPEPGTIAVFGAGLLGLAISRQRRRGRAFVALTTKPEEEEETPKSAR